MFVLAIVLFFSMILVGGERGLTSFFTLLFNILVMALTIYLIIFGINPLVVSFIGGSLLAMITLFYQNGVNEKTKAAFKSVTIVTVTLIVFTTIFCVKTGISGLNELNINEDSTFYLTGDIGIDMMMVTVPMIIIGFMGAITDTSIAVASAAYEVCSNNPELDEKQLYRSSVNIGKSVLGTTINTLYFALIGEGLMVFNVMVNYRYSLERLFNSSAFIELFGLVAFSAIACVITIPVTAKVFTKQIFS